MESLSLVLFLVEKIIYVKLIIRCVRVLENPKYHLCIERDEVHFWYCKRIEIFAEPLKENRIRASKEHTLSFQFLLMGSC